MRVNIFCFITKNIVSKHMSQGDSRTSLRLGSYGEWVQIPLARQ